MSNIISKRVQDLAPSGIRVFFDLVLGMKDVISLGVGEPDFDTPWNIREAAIYSLEDGSTSYTSNKGLLSLRQRISRFLKNRHNLDYNPEEEILITVGVSEALDLAARAIINPGDKVLIPEPCYVSYSAVTSLAGGIPVPVSTLNSDFKLTAADIEKHYDKKVKAIIFNYPSNPTGVSYTKNELESLKKVILKYNLIVISDEVYDELTYDFEHFSFPALTGMRKNTIYLNGFSKSYAMTGFRIGYACADKEIIQAMTKVHQYTMLCAPITAQLAALEALMHSAKAVEMMKREYRRRRNLVIERLNSMGLACRMPEGAFYAFASIKNTGMKSLEFCQALLKEEKVAVVPGNAFGVCGEGFIRISYASAPENLKEALNRMEIFLKKRG